MTPSPRIGIAMGDPAGISPELLAKLVARADLMATAAVPAKLGLQHELCTPREPL